MLTVLFFLFGLIIGSFLNVVVLRLEADKTLDGRSKCPSCGAIIRWYDNIPVISFFILGRQCRVCHAPISWQYPLIELATAALFALFGPMAFGAGAPADMAFTIWQLFLVSLLLVIALYDARNMEIPLVLLLIGVSGAIAYALIATAMGPFAWLDILAPWREMAWGGSIAAAVFYVLVYFSKETWMGMGDVWLAGIAGAAVGLPALLLLLTLSFCCGAIVGTGLLLFGKKGMRSQIPFAPFLTAGTFSTLWLQSLNPWWLTLFLFPAV